MRNPLFAGASILIVCVVLIICLVLLACVGASAGSFTASGGASRKPRPLLKDQHIVVDTLNLTHWLFSTSKAPAQISVPTIVRTIELTAQKLKETFPGRVMYVVKGPDKVFNDPEARDAYATAARSHGVYVYLIEQYSEPPRPSRRKSRSHSARGRDDFYSALLAKKYKAPVLTEDRFRDFEEFRAHVQPFTVLEFAFWRALPETDYVDPQSGAYRTLKKPFAVRYGEVFAPEWRASLGLPSAAGPPPTSDAAGTGTRTM